MIHVDLGKPELASHSVFISEFRKDGRDSAAGRAPVCVEVDDCVFCGFQDRVKIRGCVDLGDGAGGFGDWGPVCEDGLECMSEAALREGSDVARGERSKA